MTAKMEKCLLEMKLATKSLHRMSIKADKNEKMEKSKVKSAMQKGNMEGARIHAENAIREKNQSLNFLKMSARLDAVNQRIQTAITMNKVSKSMQGVVQGMMRATSAMNLQQMMQVMDTFEKQQEDLDVKMGVMDSAMSSTSVNSMPEGQVENLMSEVADEHGLEIERDLRTNVTDSPIGSTSAANKEQDILGDRLAALRQSMGP